MTARRTSRTSSKIGAVLATAALAMTGMALTAAPASAAEGGTECPPATSPPSPNTWIDSRTGGYRGVRKVSDERGPAGKYAMWSIQQYETFGHDFYQQETWDVDWLRGATRTDCTREERKPQPPKPSGGGGGSSSGGLGGGGTMWMIGGGSTNDDEVRYGTVGEIQPL